MVVCGLRMVAGLSIAKSQWELFPEMVLGPRAHQELGFVQTWMLALRPAFSKASRIPTTTHTHRAQTRDQGQPQYWDICARDHLVAVAT